ncbi:hypothetical protein IWW34DRAFT_763036 [Fusarium oxysporum f. sp. albedinis]|nr:hypothetical protein IWW34DRAFT_763036 [Fusarium oxysporum f. sp. albedinis]
MIVESALQVLIVLFAISSIFDKSSSFQKSLGATLSPSSVRTTVKSPPRAQSLGTHPHSSSKHYIKMTERLAHLQWLYQLRPPTGATQAQPRRGRLFGGLQRRQCVTWLSETH